MGKLVLDVAHKHQTKMNDCWYACLQMLISYHFGEKLKPFGAAQTHREGIFGHLLGTGSVQMGQIKDDHLLEDISAQMTDQVGALGLPRLRRLLERRGPVMVTGRYAPFPIPLIAMVTGRFLGHAILLAGVKYDSNSQDGDDDTEGQVWIHDPAFWSGRWMDYASFYGSSEFRMGVTDSALVSGISGGARYKKNAA